MVLHPVERVIMTIIGALIFVDVFLIFWKGIVVGLEFFLASTILGFLLAVVGQIGRRYGWQRVGDTTTATSLFVGYAVACALFNLVLLPRPSVPIDSVLVRIDGWLGYSWPVLCAWIANYPAFNDLLRAIYLMTTPQYVGTMILLGVLLDRRRLLGMAFGTVLGSLTGIFIWALFPSGGASAHWKLDEEIDKIVRPVVDSRYGAELYRLYAEGVVDVATIEVTGLIGFPSFHAVMGLITLLAAWPYHVFRLGLIGMNLLLAPAILVQGGHNLVDLIAGIAITFVVWRVGLAIYDALDRPATSVTLSPA
ncbi:phosphatase PAP2 family protein [Aminobacter sp. BA135]|uniref:phosphatase PAP2 family protein n=1 Tax=Aminobacter sp. BA135 TaxID=537596 RepID=UPI003D7BB67A